MAIDPTSFSTISSPPKSDAAIGSNQLGKTEFLRLMMEQMSHQDPLQPVDNQAFIAQLAQFASVEQMSQTNAHLEQLVMAQAASNQTAATTLVGKDLVFKTNSVSLDAAGARLDANLKADANSVSAIITDSNGKTVRTVHLEGGVNAGAVTLNWDGRDDNGAMQPPGKYQVKWVAADTHGDKIDIDSRGLGRADGITFANGYPELMVGNLRINLSDVLEIHEASKA